MSTNNEQIRLRDLAYPANMLSLLRLLLLPLTMFLLSRPERKRAALLSMAVALLTDVFDGMLARRLKQESALGKLIDPLADKLTIDVVAAGLSLWRGFPRWAVAMLLLRDLLILAGGLLIVRKRAVVPPSQSGGKATTVAMGLTLLLYTADGPRCGKPMLYLSGIPFALSVYQYVRSFFAQMQDEAATQ